MECSPALASLHTNVCILNQQTKPTLPSLVSSHGFGQAQAPSLCHAILPPQKIKLRGEFCKQWESTFETNAVRFLRRVVILDVRGIYFMLSSIITGVMLREDIQTEGVQVVAMSLEI
ncbi:uncharacterized protein LOC132162417 [Corylus avellana]|uniref:uncharacterized protein LOC132162417 n=1 Tax=Corylus avellana TaxID=13451 RepID=UPI00286AC552|nr:uncharacterized protein LOC132162417 [Corylus avellana]